LLEITGAGNSTDHAGVARCLDFMAKHFCEPMQLRDLVKISGMSLRGLSKAFKRGVGIGPGAVLRCLRIEHAKRLLIRHDLTLTQIAPMCGFRSDNTLCIAFQRIVGTSPKRFQRQYWLNVCRNQQYCEVQLGTVIRPGRTALNRARLCL
jgi:AraC family transcriptional regulator